MFRAGESDLALHLSSRFYVYLFFFLIVFFLCLGQVCCVTAI